MQTFDNKVLYIKPAESRGITGLHAEFDDNYADGLPFIPHTTIYIGSSDEVARAKETLELLFAPLDAVITEIHLSEFFPTNFIFKRALQGNK